MIEPRHNLQNPRGWLDLFTDMRGWISLIGAAIAIFFTLTSVQNLSRASKLADEGAFVEAEITAERESRSRRGKAHYQTFKFQVGDFRYQGEKKVSRTRFANDDPGDKVTVHYWTKGPKLFELSQGDYARNAKLSQMGALVAGLVAIGLLWFQGNKAISAIKARRHGIRTTATISKLVEHTRKGRPTGRGHMEFHTSDGVKGKSLTYEMHDLEALGLGTQIVVFLRKNRCWWEGDTGPRARVTSQLPKVPLPPDE